MITLTTIDDLTAALAPYRQANKSIGLVPTMGALHAGHASLVERAVGENDVTVVSDFVNPTQFNDPKDFSSYPRDLDADRALLETLHADILFAPTVEAIYPEPDTRLRLSGNERYGRTAPPRTFQRRLPHCQQTLPNCAAYAGIFRRKRLSADRRCSRYGKRPAVARHAMSLPHRARSKRFSLEQPKFAAHG